MSAVEGLRHEVASAFYGRFPELRPVQAEAITPIVEGRHVVLAASTGSGKTEAVMAPLVSRYWTDLHAQESPVILYVAPTKALVNDVETRLTGPCRQMNLRVGVRHGDRNDVTGRKTMPSVLVTTPESVDVLLFGNSPALRTVRAVVVDELHILFNTQRGTHLSILLARLAAMTGEPVQVVALSATVAALDRARQFLLGQHTDATLIRVPGQRPLEAHVRLVPEVAGFHALVTQLMGRPHTKLLVFADSRKVCEALAAALQADRQLAPLVFTHYSSLSTELRVQVERNFARASSAICIATSTLELGIDIGDIDAVILWGPPKSVESFLQRIGRGNRRSQKTNVIGCVPDAHGVRGALQFVALINAAHQGALPDNQPYELYGAVAQQILSVVGAAGEHFSRLAEIRSGFAHFSYVGADGVQDIVGALVEADYLVSHPYKNRVGPGPALHTLVDYRLIYGNMPVSASEIEVKLGAQVLGTIPSVNRAFVGPGDVIRFAARALEVRKVGRAEIEVVPAGSRRATRQLRFGKGTPHLDTFLADRVGRAVYAPEEAFAALSSPTQKEVLNDLHALRTRSAYGQIPMVTRGGRTYYLTFAGTLVNEAVVSMIGDEAADVGDLAIAVSHPILWRALPGDPQRYTAFIQSLGPLSDRSLFQELLPPYLQAEEFAQPWLKDQAVREVLGRLTTGDTVALGYQDLAVLLDTDR